MKLKGHVQSISEKMGSSIFGYCVLKMCFFSIMIDKKVLK